MRSVVVTKFAPLPADAGGKLRSFATLRELAELGPVTLVAFSDGREDLAGLARLGVSTLLFPRPDSTVRVLGGLVRTGSVSAARFWSPEMAAAVRQASHSADILYVNYAQLAPYVARTAARFRVLDLHNVESGLARSYARRSSPATAWLYRAEAAALRRIERRAMADFDAVVVVSEQEAARLSRQPRRLLVCPNGWDPGVALPPATTPTACFVALMGWAPNVDAARWLATCVWPLVRPLVPGARLLLVGRDPTPAVLALRTHDIEVTGSVPDVRPYLGASRVCLAPLRAGGGSRLKILEAMDSARPVVATTVGAEGFEDLAGHGLVLADSPEAFARATAELLADGARAEALGATAKMAVNDRYTWERTLAPLRELLRSAG